MNKELVSPEKVDEISVLIADFVQMWTQFEVMMQEKLARTHHIQNSNDCDSDNNDINYGLFYRISNIIFSRDRLTMGELSNILSVQFSKATRMINILVANGYVKRLSAPNDRRIVLIALTEKGIELYQSIDSYMKQQIQELLSSNLNDDEKGILFTLINRVAKALKDKFYNEK